MLKYTLTHIIWESDGLYEVSLLSVGWPHVKEILLHQEYLEQKAMEIWNSLINRTQV